MLPTLALLASVAPQVLGGRPAPSAEAVAVLRDDAGRVSCSGVLVAPRAVLTAAHCLPLPDDDVSKGPTDACFGPRSDACDAIPVVGFALHPEWEPVTFHADLAIVFLAGDAPAAPSALATSSANVGDVLDIVGFGRSDATSSASAGEKRILALRVSAIEQGRVVHGEGACNGDSGGPLFGPSGDVVAITSSGPPGCVDLGRATIVAPHEPWIRESTTTPNAASCAASPAKGSGAPAVAIAIAAALVARRKRSVTK